jgi:ATP-binding cassette subfamily C (CFTR/MRP) protein 5
VVLDDLRVAGQGTYGELQSGVLASSVVTSILRDDTDTTDADDDPSADHGEANLKLSSRKPSSLSRKPSSGPLATKNASRENDETGSSTASKASPSKKDLGRLTTKEDREVGAVSLETFAAFVSRFGGRGVAVAILTLFLAAEGSKNGSDAWLSAWTGDAFGQSTDFYLLVYSGLFLLLAILSILRSLLFVTYALRAAMRLHDDATNTIMRGKMEFFNTTPLGRIIARFSSDMDRVDVILVDIMSLFLSLAVRSFLSFSVIAAVVPVFLAIAVPIGYFFYWLLQYVRRAVRQIKRIENITRSPLVSHVQSTAQGLTTLRAYGELGAYGTKLERLMDDTTQAYFGFYFANRWVGFRLDICTTITVFCCSLLCVFFASQISASLAALAVTSALQTAGVFQFAVRQAAEFEAQFTSVERLRFFIESTPQEQQIFLPPPSGQEDGEKDAFTLEQAGKSWPSRGRIEFVDFRVRYRDGLPLVLNGVTFAIPGGSKAAFVGRTGSGKSTTLLCLFRILEAAGGSIRIDGVDIGRVPLKRLRQKTLSIVPQDPTLFAGTVRFNLDPFASHSDDDVWSALQRVHMADFVKSLGSAEDGTDGLTYVLEEGGANLSTGQRQLFCFARAILRGTRVIAVDEGTSSVDEATDAMIQKAMHEAFPDRTLLVVAHRLNTVRNLDHICVLDHGRVAEMGSPDELLQKKNGMFAGMWNASNNRT